MTVLQFATTLAAGFALCIAAELAMAITVFRHTVADLRRWHRL